MIAYYEADGAQPPGSMLVDLAQALDVATDELLGLKPVEKRSEPQEGKAAHEARKGGRATAP